MRPFLPLLLLALPGALLAQTAPAGGSKSASATGKPAQAATATSGKWFTPRPPYPYQARATGEQGDGTVRVSTDAAGRVTRAAMVQSSGSDILNSNTVNFAKAYWHGPPDSTITLPLSYRIQGGVTPRKWHTPAPPIPADAPKGRAEYRLSVRVSTDYNGKVVSAKVAQSSGDASLDASTLAFAKKNWVGKPNASATVPVTYKLR